MEVKKSIRYCVHLVEVTRYHYSRQCRSAHTVSSSVGDIIHADILKNILNRAVLPRAVSDIISQAARVFAFRPSSRMNGDALPGPPAKRQKLGGYDFYRSIGSPKWVVAPMVDQSELVGVPDDGANGFRLIVRHGVCYPDHPCLLQWLDLQRQSRHLRAEPSSVMLEEHTFAIHR